MSNSPHALTASQLAALAYYAKPLGERTGRSPHTNTNLRLRERGLTEAIPNPDAGPWEPPLMTLLTDAGRATLAEATR